MSPQDRRALATVAVCLLGAAWVLIPHRFEGRVLFVISEHYGLGVHKADPIGAGVALIAVIVINRRRRPKAGA